MQGRGPVLSLDDFQYLDIGVLRRIPERRLGRSTQEKKEANPGGFLGLLPKAENVSWRRK